MISEVASRAAAFRPARLKIVNVLAERPSFLVSHVVSLADRVELLDVLLFSHGHREERDVHDTAFRPRWWERRYSSRINVGGECKNEAPNGIDANEIGRVDDATEVEGPVQYPVPLKGIQIKIRVYDPDSRQIREVTLTQDFLSD